MIKIFGIVVNMSITASIVILAVILLRLLFCSAPKIFSYLLWLVVLVRLLYPVTLEADFGFLPDLNTVQIADAVGEPLSKPDAYNYVPEEVAGDADVDEKSINAETVVGYENGVPGTDVNEDTTYIYNAADVKIGEGSWSFVLLYEIAGILSVVWLIVGSALLLYEVLSYSCFVHRLKKQQRQTLPEKEKVLVLENISTPFVAGIFRPVVYLPAGMDAAQKELVTAHEKKHIKRLDYLVKPLFLLACCVHWFNPLVWLAFCLMIQDMESSCDEAVLQEIGFERKKEYAYTLLELAQDRSWKVGYPLAFGENNVRSRVKNMVKAKKSTTWVVVVVAFVAGMATVLLLVNRQDTEESIAAAGDQLEVTHQSVEEQADEEQADVQLLPSEEITVTAVPGTDSNEDTTMHEYYMSDKENETIDTDGTMTHLSEELEQGNANGDTIMNYQPDRDKFAVLLLDSPGTYDCFGILYRYPVEGASISSAFGTRIHPITREEKIHSGVDFVAEEGTPIVAAADGTVVKTGFDVENGNYVILQHSNGDATYYTACKEILTQEGSKVSAGDQIATVGSTGTSTGPHLHFAVSRQGEFVEPEFVGE